MSNGDGDQDYSITVQQYSDEELLDKERSKRRRKTGDIVGTGLCAAAAIGQPALWAVAATSTKAFFGNSSKHKIILQEIERRGLTPLKGDMSDMIMPVLGSAGSMAVGRAFGGAKGAGLGSMAGNLMRNASVRAFNGGSSKKDRKDKALKRVFSTIDEDEANLTQAQTVPSNEMVPYSQTSAAGSRNAGVAGVVTTQQGQQALMTPSSYQIPRDQTPPATLVYQYYPPTSEYPRGYYAPPQTPMTVPAPQQPQPVYQQPQMVPQPTQQYLQAPQQTQQYLQAPPATYQQQPMPPALPYHYAQPEPQYYQGAPQQQAMYGTAPAYDAPPMYQPSIQRANTFQY